MVAAHHHPKSSRRLHPMTMTPTVGMLLLSAMMMPLLCSSWVSPFAVGSINQKNVKLHPPQRHLGHGRSTPSSSSALWDSPDDHTASGDSDFRKHMELVRSLQLSYYKDANISATFDASLGQITHLPLWRVQWSELPGRSNILNVHQAMYTNMFERTLRGPKPWYVGHLFLPQGSRNLPHTTSSNDDDDAFRLKSWQEERDVDKATRQAQQPRSAVIGTLLEIADYRRMQDGRLLLLVKALERFAVSHVRQELPYSVADVQLLPDLEEVDPDHLSWVNECTEGDIRTSRSMAVRESQFYHLYEFDESFSLPIPDKSDLAVTDILGSMLTLVLPFVPFSKTANLERLREKPLSVDAEEEKEEPDDNDRNTVVVENELEISSTSGQSRNNYKHNFLDDYEPCLEQQLLQGGILKAPTHPDETIMALTMEELEYKLWLAMNDFLKRTKTPVSPVLLGLLPPSVEWPSNFYLRKIANEIDQRTDLKHNYQQVSPLYPAHRRLRRLSFSASTLFENLEGLQGLRQTLLETASTKARLALLLELLETFNAKDWGEFE